MQSIGKYEVLEKIGVGGFGVVYKGYDPFIKRFVAIKTCNSDDEEIRHRFFREAEISGNLQHRNVVTVYDFGVQDEVPYLIQEYLTGEDLDRKVKRREDLTYAEKILYLVQIARGLEYAHSKGVVHRDVKPANVRILEDGTAKIMDFGIAKLAQGASGLTQTGMTLGTAAYLAPEQIRGEAVDPRTDIFSFGILAYELFTYERPFGGEVISAALYQILNARARPLNAHWADCPPELSRVVEKAMEKEPHRRYQTCTELLRDLDQLLRRLRPERGRSLAASGELTSSTSRALTAGLTAAASPAPPPPAAPADLDLAYRLDSHRQTPRSISTSAAYRQKEISWTAWGGAALALVLLLAGGGWYWQRSRAAELAATAARGEPQVVAAAMGSAPAEPAGATPPPAAGEGAPPAASEPPAAPTAGEVPAAAAAAPAVAVEPPVAISTAAPAAPEPEPPPPPKRPEKATLVLAASWNPETTASVDGGAARRLDRQQKVEVAPGDHVVTFALLLPDYQDLQDHRVSLRPGQRLALESPIERPGRLTVQAAMESPQGMVRIDGQSLGLSPRLRHPLRPGSHQVEITPLEPGGAARVAAVSVRSDGLVVVTFDLRKDEPPRISEQSPTGP